MAQKILMVDDDPVMHKLYHHHLEQAGYEMVSAANGNEALEVAQRELPDLIVMDVMMPKMDGLTALRQLKKTETTKAIPTIVITANANAYEASRHESEASGAALFVTKPISPHQLLAEIRRLLPSEKS
jgi:two-component system alkaline phosphatase synthesis response regulator PhoP